MTKEFAQLDKRATSRLKCRKIKGEYNFRRSIFGTKCRKIWAWGRTRLEWQGASMTSQVNTTLGTNGKAQSKSSTLVCTSHSPHSRLFHEVHIFCCSIFCMRKLTLCNKLDHSSASHMLAKHKFYSLTSTQFLWDHQFRRIPLKLLKKCDIIRLKYFFPSWLIIAWRL